MPHGNLTRYEMLSKVYKLKDELKDRKELSEKKVLQMNISTRYWIT